MKKGKLVLSLVLAAITLAVLFWILGDSILAQELEPQGFVGAQVNGKDCEVVVSLTDHETVFTLNPELSDEEKALCQRLIKEAAVAQSQTEIAEQFVPGEILVKFRERPANAEQALTHAKRLGLAVKAAAIRNNWAKLVLDQPSGIAIAEAKSTTIQALETVRQSGQVEWAEPNYIAHASVVTPTWGQQAIGAPQAWSVVSCNPAIGVAVIDTGVYSDHVELSGHVVAGWDFVNDDADPSDDHGHGTHVASTAVGFNVGICPGGTAVVYKVCDSSGSCTYDDVASGIISATQDSRVKIINLSLGGLNPSSVLEDATNQAADAGKLVFSASGNGLGEYPEYPARYEGAIPVGAIDWDWRVTTWSTRFQGVEDRSLVAPGVDVWGADYSCPTCYIAKNGTSMATPHAAGSAALLWSTNPSLTAEQVKNYLLDNTVELGDPQEYGQGALHIGAAVKAAMGANFNLDPIPAWPMPFPSHGNPGEMLIVMALPRDLDGTIVAATAAITTPTGPTSINMTPGTLEGVWEGSFVAVNEGVYTATISVSDGISSITGFGSVNLRVLSPDLPSGWPQYGRVPEGGSWLSYVITDVNAGVQQYSPDNNLSAASRETVVVENGRGDIPEGVRIVSSPTCPLGNNYGRRWLFNPQHGIYYGWQQVYTDAIPLSCSDGVGMFGNSAAIAGLAFSLDEGSGRSDSQDSRLHAFDLWGRQYWLIQLGYYGDGMVKTSPDGHYIYTVHGIGSTGGMWQTDLMGRRRWHFAGYVSVPPAVTENAVFVKSDSSGNRALIALNPTNGSELWRYPVASNMGYSAPALSPDGEAVIFCDGDEQLHAVRASDGQGLWVAPLADSYCYSTPAVTPQYVVQYTGGIYPDFKTYLHLVNLEDGGLVTTTLVTSYGGTSGSPAVIGDLAFLPDSDGMVRAYRLPTLEKVWEDEVDPFASSQWQLSASVEDEQYCRLYAAGNNGYFRSWLWPCTKSQTPILSITKTGPVTATTSSVITYTISLNNAGTADATGVVVTDVLPAGLFGPSMQWTGDINAGQVLIFTLAATVTAPAGTVITNTACYSHTSGNGCASWPFTVITTTEVITTYLPIILRNFP